MIERRLIEEVQICVYFLLSEIQILVGVILVSRSQTHVMGSF